MKKRFCTHCGAEVAIGESHCMECGKKLPHEKPPQPIIQPPAQPTTQHAQSPTMYPNNPYSQNLGQRNKQPLNRFGQTQPLQGEQVPALPVQMTSQPFVVYLYGLLIGKKDALKMEFETNASKNSILLLILFLIFSNFIYGAIIALFPFNVDPDFLNTIVDKNLLPAGATVSNQTFAQFISITGLLTVLITNILLGTLTFSFLLNSNHIRNIYKKGFIIAVASLLPIVILEIVRYIGLVLTTSIASPILISDITSFANYLSIIFNSDLGSHQEIRTITLLLRIAWTAFLMKRIFEASGIDKQKIPIYTILFTLFVGGGYDLLNQMYFMVLPN